MSAGNLAGVRSDMAERMKAFECEVRELRQTNEILKKALALLRPGAVRPPALEVTALMRAHVESYWVEPMFKVLQITPSIWHGHAR